MNDRDYEQAFQLILKAGNARTAALMAVEAAREGDFAEAKVRMQENERELHEAHALQLAMIQQEAGGEPVPVNVVLVHAQDHLTMALMARDNAREFIHLYKMLQEKQKED